MGADPPQSLMNVGQGPRERYGPTLRSPSAGVFAVEVCHGPIHYADVAGAIDTQDKLVQEGVQSWLIKRARFAAQSEYRFAVRAFAPARERYLTPVSPDLRTLTSPL